MRKAHTPLIVNKNTPPYYKPGTIKTSHWVFLCKFAK